MQPPKLEQKINYSYIWGKSYQTDNDPVKNAKFKARVNKLYGNAPKEEELREVTNKAAARYASIGYSPKKLSELLYRIALHESDGGLHTKQISGGPARSWFQIEIKTAMNLVKKCPELIKGYDAKELSKLSYSDMGNLLETRQDIAAVIAAAKIIETGERLGTNTVLKHG